MSELKLEVGKTYLNRVGETVRIIKVYDEVDEFPFYCDGGGTYTVSGKYSSNSENEYDLIEEIKNKSKPPLELKLEVGKSYSNKITKINEILKNAPVLKYPFFGENVRSYMQTGIFSENSLNDYDLTQKAPEKSAPKKAADYLHQAAEIMAERGKQYDSPEGERSMGKTVKAFNIITGQDMTEAQGWLFMSVLKKVRQYQGKPHLDSCEDDVAYAALFAEARMAESKK